jgi:hypothetical protein
MRVRGTGLLRSEAGAVAPTVALSLFGLIAAGGLAFDYARLASLDTELQQAADHAALAAASQLDRKANACIRAAQAASAMVANETRFANDGGGIAIVVANEADCDATGKIRFWQDAAKTTAATDFSNARFVEVEVNDRRANYALTPIVGALTSGDITGIAFAGLGSSVCRVPPLMMCNPQETAGNTTFDPSALAGVGMRLVDQGGGSTYVPGNFGYLESGVGPGASELKKAIGWDNPPGVCISTSAVNTEPGQNNVATDFLNTRLDVYANGLNSANCQPGGNCSPSRNSRKDVANTRSGGAPINNCNFSTGAGGQGWKLPANYYGQTVPTSAATPLTTAQMPSAMGHPRDMCHAISTNGSCAGGRIGNGVWDRNAYFHVNYGSGFDWRSAMTSAGYNPDTVTRYEVYRWEIDNPANIDAPRTIGSLTAYGAPVCQAPGLTPGAATPDRRRLTIAVVNCLANNVRGRSTNVPVNEWVDVFLVEPSLNRARTSSGEIYVEVIGPTITAGDGAQLQLVRRDVPYLIE